MERDRQTVSSVGGGGGGSGPFFVSLELSGETSRIPYESKVC